MPSSRRRRLLLAAVFLAGLAVSVVRFGGPTYTLQDGYTDHLRHEYTAWSFLQVGPEIWQRPLGAWQVDSGDRHIRWPALPHPYPPGSVLLFLPFALVANLLPWPDVAHASMPVLFGAAGGVAGLLLHRALTTAGYPRPLATALAALATPALVFWGLNGFFDTVAVAAALLGIIYLRTNRPGTALLCLAGALALHYRLWYLAPLAAGALLAHRRWDRRTTTAAVAIVGSALALPALLPALSILDRRLPDFQPNPVEVHGATGMIVAGVLLAVIAAVLARERFTTIATIGLAALVVLLSPQWQAWHPLASLPVLPLATTPRGQALVTFLWVQVALIVPGTLQLFSMVRQYLQAVA